MVLICKPKGRGNWSTVRIEIDGKRIPKPDLFQWKRGEVLVLGTLRLRVVEVRE